MVTRADVTRLIEQNHSYEEAASRLGIRPGQAYLIGTGMPVDSTDGHTEEEFDRPGVLPSAQHLANPRTEQPDRSSHVLEFLSARAESDAQMQSAGRSS